ncbi:16S rRNA (cytidine(1402)-2'-O)-methyltransferase [Echinimonas agarilytica]|uniref:Ribosomal RNA small subunit methyltransferase I n=1 Tax=Echinimonas agarilytica TaxID=1215918 RepID=A0AA42B6C6_9GAMM|nr:16S rRNA (cytidine(1402)-2'-O)-methyltransferase [Echinimonas agarilytica]MCM2678640.1 16S rRNA (cytidine(1402)-2'-O)-methyltransferase [Echinimonas agarilytica]
MSGILFIVPTPIGNLGDISARALEVLAEVDVIAAEDTRHTRHLLNHFGIKTRCISLHLHNENQRSSQFVDLLQKGESIALVSDAGTPLISDPGYPLVNALRHAGCQVVPLPGPCAATTALCAAGLPTDRFCFEGFLPAKASGRKEKLEALKHETRTMLFYESPRRVFDTLESMAEIMGHDRHIVVAKELTKRFETFISGTAAEIIDWFKQAPERQKGEMVIMLSGTSESTDAGFEHALELAIKLKPLMPPKQAAAIASETFNVKKNAVYKAMMD